jgi:endonuclease/exonuclease/phosphatase family metal-dependent hydrolase
MSPLFLGAAVLGAALLLYGDCLGIVKTWKSGVHIVRVAYVFGVTHRKRQNEPVLAAEAVAAPTAAAVKLEQIATVDFRRRGRRRGRRRAYARDALRVVSWNIEFGYCLDSVLAVLADLDADVVLLQEVDRFDDSASGGARKDCFEALARRLGMCGVWAGHHQYASGMWGCAVLSRFALSDPRFVRLEALRGYPRGAVSAVAATPLGRIALHSLHTEVCCGVRVRIAQFERALRRGAREPPLPSIVGGDFNTIGGQMASRLFPMHCTDALRLNVRAFPAGESEAEFWQRTLFASGAAWAHLGDPFDKRRDATLRAFAAPPLSLLNGAFSAKLDWLLLSDGLRAAAHRVVRSARSDAASDHHPLMCSVVA